MFKNPFKIEAYAGRAVTADPLQKYRFAISVPNYDNPAAGFSKCSGIVDEVDVVEYCEGVWGYTHRIPGRNKVEPVTLERGAYSGLDGLNAIDATRTNPNMRGNIIISVGRSQSEKSGSTEAFSIILAEAWVSKVELGDFDATSGDVLIEKMTVQYEYIVDTKISNSLGTTKDWFTYRPSSIFVTESENADEP